MFRFSRSYRFLVIGDWFSFGLLDLAILVFCPNKSRSNRVNVPIPDRVNNPMRAAHLYPSSFASNTPRISSVRFLLTNTNNVSPASNCVPPDGTR